MYAEGVGNQLLGCRASPCPAQEGALTETLPVSISVGMKPRLLLAGLQLGLHGFLEEGEMKASGQLTWSVFIELCHFILSNLKTQKQRLRPLRLLEGPVPGSPLVVPAFLTLLSRLCSRKLQLHSLRISFPRSDFIFGTYLRWRVLLGDVNWKPKDRTYFVQINSSNSSLGFRKVLS